MSARTRRRSTAAAVALTAGITAGAALLLSACGPEDVGATGTATPSAAKSGPAKGGAGGAKVPNGSNGSAAKGGTGSAASAQPAVSAAPALVNGTAHNGLTISNGTRYVVMNGTRVDFGTAVRDLSWAPDGRHAVFVDGDGDLAISNPDGSGRVVVARNPGGQNWSHPTWQLRKNDSENGYPGANDIFWAIRPNGGVSRLYGVAATAHNGTPKPITLNHESGEGIPALPAGNNVWPSAGGTHGTAVYANTADGEVYIRDDYLRQQGSALTPGSEPAMSPTDSQDIVFVRSAHGHDHLFLEHTDDAGRHLRDLTPNATTDYTEPAFSADGTTIAARTSGGIVTVPVNGSHTPVKVSGYVGLPAYRAF